MKKLLVTLSFFVLFSIMSVSSVFANALLIQDNVPWDSDSNPTTLAAIGIAYTQIGSADLATMSQADLASYTFVVYASDQTQTYYDNVGANLAKIETYVNDGGILIGHTCAWGWEGSVNSPPNILPGGVLAVNEYSNFVRVVDATAAPITGPYGTITEASLQAWNWSTHGYFANLGAVDEHVVIDLNDPTKPVYITYGYGAGEVRANVMTVEWGSNDPTNTRYIFRENEFYAGQNEPPDNQVPEPASLILIGLGLVGIAGAKRKFKK